MNSVLHQAFLVIGSNISPIDNLKNAVRILEEYCLIDAVSMTWENPPVGSSGPNFYNAAISIRTLLSKDDLKNKILYPIETHLKRIRTSDKNAPRTIDLDIILFEGVILDPEIWIQLYLALPISEFLPDLINPENGKSLKEIAEALQEKTWALPHPEISYSFSDKS
jgi:2-amino-4-hydroxy-6-hydroxymethyldihydropteridine diphosphokinase